MDDAEKEGGGGWGDDSALLALWRDPNSGCGLGVRCPSASIILAADPPRRGALLLGSIDASTDAALLAEHGVVLVVQCAGEKAGRVTAAITALAADISGGGARAAEVLELGLADAVDIFGGPAGVCASDDDGGAALAAPLAVALPRIEAARSAGGTVLVSCARGASRSAIVVAAYLMVCEGHSAATALLAIARARAIASPNVGFVLQLFRCEAAATGRSRPSASRAALRARAAELSDGTPEWGDHADAAIATYLTRAPLPSEADAEVALAALWRAHGRLRRMGAHEGAGFECSGSPP